MRVIAQPIEGYEVEDRLEVVMRRLFRRDDGPAAMAKLVCVLVEKGVLTLADCQTLGAPHMKEVK